MKLADLHIHSEYSIETNKSKFTPLVKSSMTIEQIFEKAEKKGLSAIAITDHDNIEASFKGQELAKKYGIILIPSLEITTREGHVLAYGVSKNIKPLMSAKEAIDEVHRQNGVAVAAHPFYFMGLNAFYSLKRRQYVKLLAIDGVEAVSCATGISHKSKKIAKMLNLAVIGGSDAHCLSVIGFGLTIFPDECKSVDDYLKAMRERKTFVIKGRGLKSSVWLKTIYSASLRPFLSSIKRRLIR